MMVSLLPVCGESAIANGGTATCRQPEQSDRWDLDDMSFAYSNGGMQKTRRAKQVSFVPHP
jgi:hypothetical protein